VERRRVLAARSAVAVRPNREIAAALYLSEKTVETHLSRIFVKLGVANRAAVARLVERARQREPV
jgi:DNA-binding NarL/FixJ family response regulator